jgi:hypothetical protein
VGGRGRASGRASGGRNLIKGLIEEYTPEVKMVDFGMVMVSPVFMV